MESLYKISITCFTASYLVVFALELARVLSQAKILQAKPVRYFKIAFAVAALFAHGVYLVCHGGLLFNHQGIELGNWFTWCLAAAWVLAAAYLWISLRRSESVFGLFLLPVVTTLIWIGLQFGNSPTFSTTHARSGWNLIHGASLLLGTAVVALGCIFGVVYLLQSHRLKQKIPQATWLRLPSLEWLQQACERALLISAALLGLGLISGIAITQFPVADTVDPGSSVGSTVSANRVTWSDPVVWTSGVLFAWLTAATIFNLFYRPARQGRKVAYLVVASFLFFVLELSLVWWLGHATTKPITTTTNQTSAEISEDR